MACNNTLQTYASPGIDSPHDDRRITEHLTANGVNPAFTLTADFDTATTLPFDFECVPYLGSIPMSQSTIEIRSGVTGDCWTSHPEQPRRPSKRETDGNGGCGKDGRVATGGDGDEAAQTVVMQ